MNKNKTKKSLGFMQPQNLTAISLAGAGQPALHSGTGPHILAKHPALLLFSFFFVGVVRNQTNCPHSKLQQYSGTTSFGALLQRIPPTPTHPVQSVQCSRLLLTKELLSCDLWAGNMADAGAKQSKMTRV